MLKSQISKNERFLRWLIYITLVAYMFLVARLSGYRNSHFIFVGLIFIVLARSKKAFGGTLIFTTIFAILLSPLTIYGKVNYGSVLAILFTNLEEASGFITTLSLKVYIYVGFVIILTLVLFRHRKLLVVNKQTSYVLSIIFIAHLMFYDQIKEQLTVTRNFIVHDAINLVQYYQQVKTDLKAQNLAFKRKLDWNPQVNHSEFDTYVVVIGESARRSALNAYGYRVENTPFLSNVPRIQFDNYISAGGFTDISLSNTLILDFAHHLSNNTVINLANTAGFATYWFSNHHEKGVYDNLVGKIAKGAHKHYFLTPNFKKEKPTDDYSSKDEDLLPYFTEALNDKDATKKLVVLHLVGSHRPFCKKVDDKFDIFITNKELSCYVQSIKNTDKLLGDVYNLLQNHKQQTGKEWTMVYFSDHGLANSGNNELLHNNKFQENFAVPFVLLNSKLTTTTFINAQRSGLSFFNFFSSWTGINDKLIKRDCDFVSEEGCPNSDLVIKDRWQNNVDNGYYSQLPKEPFNPLVP